MEKQIEIHAYHGWGFDESFWEPLRRMVPDTVVFKAANRGYFGETCYPRFDKETKLRVVFTHSFGLHWCKTAVLSKADYLVIMNGFGSFCPADPKLHKVSEKSLSMTIAGFDKDPEETLKAFRKNTFTPAQVPDDLPAGIDHEKAAADLHAMKKVDFPIIDLDFGATIIALDSKEDKILLQARGDQMLHSYVGRKHIKLFTEAGHALPYTKPADCWSYLCSVIPIFEGYENND